MQVILTEDVYNVGEMGEIVTVTNGYGRNYLIPQGLALPATASNAKALQHQMAQIERKKEALRQKALGILKDIDGISVTIPMRAGDNDKLYGSVTNRDIAEALTQHGVTVERKHIQLERALTELGIYKIRIKLASGVDAHVKVWVVAM